MSTVATSSIADKLRSLAAGLESQIEDRRRPMTQNATPKRLREYSQRVHEGDNLERGRLALLALADSHERGDVPELLTRLKTKAAVLPLVATTFVSTGYYDYHGTNEYRDKSPAGLALQKLLAEAKSPSESAAEAEQRKAREVTRLEHALHGMPIPGFFPTPAPLVQMLLDYAAIGHGHDVLEPSAGKGDIADAIRVRCPDANLAVCEIQSRLQEILKAKGYFLAADDFLEYGGMLYDRIVANPPFERMADVDHLLHAYGLLKLKGRLVFIVSESPFFRSDKKASAFREFLAEVSAEVHDVEAGAFTGAQAFRQTGVKCRIVVIDKPLLQ